MSCTGTCHSHINLTSKGKLLLIDVERAKRDEFNRRRRLRLQQVRQQSNEIAREIRDKVKAEKHMRYSQEELKKQAHFDKWKEAQMKTLQDEFNRRALLAEQDKENASKEAELVELECERQRVLEDIAKKRGNLAVLKQRRDKLSVETESFLKTSNAKFNRSLENLRSALVASLPKSETKKVCFDSKPNAERRIPSPSKIQKVNTDEIITDKLSEESEDFSSVMRIVSGDTCQKRMEDTERRGVWNPPSCQSSSNSYSSSYRPNAVSPEKFLRQKCRSSPDKRHFDDLPRSPRKSESVGWSYTLKDFPGSGRSPCLERGEKSSLQSSVSQPSSKQGTYRNSPGKRLANTDLMSPSKRVASSQCSHSKDSSPVRCGQSYSPNKYRDELDQGDSNRFRSRHVRFEENDSLNRSNRFESSLGRNRTVSEGESDGHSESDVTWPPRNWNRNQEEEVILYNHCGRSTSKYQPKHTISVISNQENDDALEEELEACRERALRKHEEALRERRGCRALYRQRLRAEFSCMISDLANLDKQTRLAKLETEAKAALLPRKLKKKPSDAAMNKDQMDVDKEDPPGSVQVMDCTDSINIDYSDKKSNIEVCRQEPMECNLEALDQLLTRLKEQRDHLLACQEVRETLDSREDRNVQSTSVQCSVPERIDHSTSPRISSPTNEIAMKASPFKESRGTSPVQLVEMGDASHGEKVVPPLPTKEFETERSQVRGNSPEKKKVGESVSKNVAESPLNISKQEAHCKVSDESSSGVSIDGTSYSFNGVKVEVKVSKNKTKKTEKSKKIRISTDEKPDDKIGNETPKNDSWAKKLAENSSSTGTSYMSPPEELNPEEHKLLISVLEGMDKKNNNPILAMYIQKLLSMSKGSLDNMSISVSEDSAMSEAFKSCYENIADINKAKQSDLQINSSYSTAQSQERSLEEFEKRVEVTTDEAIPVRRILESDEGSVINQDSVLTDEKDCQYRHNVCHAPGAEYIDALKQYNDRLKLLTKMMTEEKAPFKKSYSESDTSYLAIPSDLAVSIKLTESAQEVGLLRPDESCSDQSEEQLTTTTAVATTLWGVRSNILPKPDLFAEKRPKPPSTINNYVSRGVIIESMPPHELSTIAEGDSKIHSSFQPYSSHQQTSSTDKKCITKSSVSPKESKISEEESYQTLPPTGFPVSSETSVISSANISPVKIADESSLHIFTEYPDSSFGQSSAEEVAVSEVFRSLGIGWALSTWRKTHEASRKVEETSSSSPSETAGQNKKKLDEMRCRHSTPIKAGESEVILKITESDDNHLTPPTVSLYERYQNLIRSASISSSNDS